MKLETLRTALTPAVEIIFPVVAWWANRTHLTRNDTNPIAVILRRHLEITVTDYAASRSFLVFVRDFLATHSSPMPDDFTECLARYILNGENCVERI